eukprot:CAMPEP_0115018002 /NCGR_PEP_ID=MMETSP0216-20121206/28504_1 /TAXON_ID=223996 /ORGANISM="Protocruzia adherens, Strain Boccale" /LENGTH=59 /DNA_ID=CAMNT_0002389029 /DNA_START=40 /DNA_END=216 /DNA_ORIENTATION=-
MEGDHTSETGGSIHNQEEVEDQKPIQHLECDPETAYDDEEEGRHAENVAMTTHTKINMN